MSELSEEARAKAKDKAERLVRSDPKQRVDASGYSPEGPLDGDVQTGPRPVSPRQYRRGGKVAGEASAPRADRKPRASGGRTLTADSLINRDVKEANQERDGTKHIGGMKAGGRALPPWAHRAARAAGGRTGKFGGGALTPQQRMGLQQGATIAPAAAARPMPRPMMRKEGGKVHADEAQDRKLIHEMGCQCGKCGGGRVGRKEGGGNWIAGAIKHPGALHRELGVPEGKKIPAKKLAKATHSDNPKLARRANMAETLKGLPHKKDGGAINDGTRPVAGRLARKTGGRTKKGTNVNIIITQPPARPTMPMPPPGMARPAGGAPPVGMAQGMPPTGTAPMPPPGAAGVPPAAPLMPRASGGRTNDGWSGQLAKPGQYPIDAGAGGGLGRLEKAQRAARS
jgi:hypothetical protein